MKRHRAWRIAAWALLGLLLLGTARAEDPDPDAALAEAWYLLEVERKPEEAALRYEALSRAEQTPSVRARALLGLARAVRLLGRPEEAQRYLDEAFRLSPELGAVRDTTERAGSSDEPTRYVTGWVRLTAGQGLDLDGGGVYPGPRTFSGARVEVFNGPGGLVRPEGAEVDAGFMRRVAVAGPRPWLRLVTDEGRLAFFQVLLPGPEPMLRFVTRVSGRGPVLPEVRGAFCLGRSRDRGDARGIEIHFLPTSGYVAYRVEARRNALGPFEPLGEVSEPPFVHADAEAGVRYGYRLTGLDAAGNAGIPTALIGTSTSAGIVSGTIEMRRGESFDLLTGREAPAGGDLKLVNTYGGASAAGLVDARGRPVRELALEASRPRALWDGVPPHAHGYVEDGGVFVVPLEGGGVARCRLEMQDTREHRDGPEARIRYETQPDGIVFPPPPVLLADRAPDGVRVQVTGLLTTDSVPYVVAHDLLEDAPARRLTRQTAAGVFLDDAFAPRDEPVIRYEATPLDRSGRRGVAGSVVYDGRAPGVRTGTFKLHYEQGWSFVRGAVVPAAEADVFFESCAGGISSITLAAPGGITNLERSLRPPLGEDRHAGDPETLAACVVGLDPDRVRLDREAHGDRRRPAADVFVLRLRDGGWARLAIVDREKHADGGWTKKRATIRYAWNPREPRFDEDVPADLVTRRDDGYVVLPLGHARERFRQEHLGHLPPKPAPGTFAFHHHQGFSFEEGHVVESEEHADVYFETCAGGIASITLEAAGGIVNLEGLYRRDVRGRREPLFDAILGIEDDRALERGGRRAEGDARTPASDVFLLRTRHGGWVKMVILERGSEGGWTEHLAQVRYVFNPHAPVFADDAASGVVRGPLRVRASATDAFPEAPPTPTPPPSAKSPPSSDPPPEAWLPPEAAPPEPPAPWLRPYRTERATAEAYDRLRVALIRNPDDAFVVAGLVYLAGAHDPRYRRLAAQALPGAYVLGVQGGEGAADALRRLARDPDPWARYRALSMGQVLDTPLARELLLRHLDGATPLPDGEVWPKVRAYIGNYVRAYVERVPLPPSVAAGDEAARARWIAEAPEKPATADAHRFRIIDLEAGVPHREVIEPGDEAMGIPGRYATLTASGFSVKRTADGLVSADFAFLREEYGGGGYTAVGGATPYAASRGGTTDAMHVDMRRVIGERRLRVWRRPAAE